MSHIAKLLDALSAATSQFERSDAARDRDRQEVIDAALAALKAGAEPEDVYNRSPFSSTYIRSLAREAGLPPGRPGIKPRISAEPDHDDSP